jgi:hypothetical protein
MIEITQKEQRFKLIEDALKVVIEPLQKIVASDDLGFSAETLNKYKTLKFRTKSNYEYFSFLADAMIETYKNSTDECFWQIYKPAFLQAQSDSRLEFKEKYEHKHIDNAIQNAFYFFFGLYAILPRIYQNAFNKELDDEIFWHLIINSNKFAKTMSIIHFDMFRSFLNSSSQTKSGVATQLHMFFPDTFVISEDLEISMSPTALARAKAHTKRLLGEGKAFIDKENPTLGCPAKFVKLDADRDLIDLLHDWIIKVVDKYFFGQEYAS